MKFSQVVARASLGLVFSCALLSAPTLAQDGDWLDEGRDPLSPTAQPAPEPGVDPVPEEELTADEQRKRGRVIDRNYQEAQRTYGEVLAKDPTGPLDRRIKNNERIVTEFSGRIENGTKARRQAQVDLYNRTFFLKQQLDKKQITPDVYERLIREEEDKFARAEATYKVNVVAWQQEVDEAQKRLDELRSQRRLLEAQKPRRPAPRRTRGGGEAEGEGGPQGSRLVGTLRDRLQRLGHFERRNTLDGVHPRTLGGGTGAVSLAAESE